MTATTEPTTATTPTATTQAVQRLAVVFHHAGYTEVEDRHRNCSIVNDVDISPDWTHSLTAAEAYVSLPAVLVVAKRAVLRVRFLTTVVGAFLEVLESAGELRDDFLPGPIAASGYLGLIDP